MEIIKLELLKFGESVSIRGVPKVFKSNSKCLQAVWFFCVISSSLIVIWQMITMFNTYYQWPFVSIYTDGKDSAIPFPDITICNLFSLGKLVKTDAQYVAYKNAVVKMLADNAIMLETQFSDQLDDVKQILESQKGYIINQPIMETVNRSCPNNIFHCDYYDWDWARIGNCLANQTERWTPDFHNCQTIHIDHNSSDTRAMSLLINIDNLGEKQFPFPTDLIRPSSTGIWFFVHYNKTWIDTNRGYVLPTGTDNVVYIFPTIRNRLPLPYGTDDCTDTMTLANSTITYTYEACHDTCQQKHIFDKCGCLSSRRDLEPNFINDNHVCGNFTGNTNTTIALLELLCSLSYEFNEKCDEICSEPCQNVQYELSVTSTTWPNPSYQRSFFDKFIKPCLSSDRQMHRVYSQYTALFNDYDRGAINEEQMTMGLRSMHTISRNFLAVKFIVRNEFPFTLTDKPQYNGQSMMGMVGGCLSLWLGITVMTAVEFVELAYTIILMIAQKTF